MIAQETTTDANGYYIPGHNPDEDVTKLKLTDITPAFLEKVKGLLDMIGCTAASHCTLVQLPGMSADETYAIYKAAQTYDIFDQPMSKTGNDEADWAAVTLNIAYRYIEEMTNKQQ